MSSGLLIALIVLDVAVLAALVAVSRRAADRVVAGQVRRRCVVSCKDGSSFDGVLLDADRCTLVLTRAVSVGGPDPVPVDGQVFVFRSDVAFIQFP